MIPFVERPDKVNKDCADYHETAVGCFCRNAEIDEVLEKVKDGPKITSCKGCFNFGVSTRLIPLKEKKTVVQRKVKKKKKKSKSKPEREVKEKKVKSRVKKFGKRK